MQVGVLLPVRHILQRRNTSNLGSPRTLIRIVLRMSVRARNGGNTCHSSCVTLPIHLIVLQFRKFLRHKRGAIRNFRDCGTVRKYRQNLSHRWRFRKRNQTKTFRVFATGSTGRNLGNVQLRITGQLITLTKLVTAHIK